MTRTPFTPTTDAAFQFLATLDGSDYNVIITWNIYRADYYLNIFTKNGVVALSRALVSSPEGYDISLTAGIFTSTFVYRQSTNTFEVNP